MINLYSDTQTLPSGEMRDAARDAEVGDHNHDEDPTARELEERAAEAVGKEAGLFVPSGTMGNQMAVRAHTGDLEEVIVEGESHVYKYEQGGLAANAGLQVRPVDAGPSGVFTPEQLREAYVEPSLHRPGTGLVCVENTHNAKGGVAIPPDRVDAVCETAAELGVPVHLDGARVFNAAVALDVPAARIAENVDSVMFCFSKGLGAPIGSLLAGDREFIERARKYRKLYGGEMRQVGIVAAPALLSLENAERLAEDHENARRLAEGLSGIDGLSANDPDTNIVLVDTEGADLTAEEFIGRCEAAGVRGSRFGEYTVRFCTHLDVDREDVEEAIDAVEGALSRGAADASPQSGSDGRY